MCLSTKESAGLHASPINRWQRNRHRKGGREALSKVEWKKFGDVCDILDSQRKPVAKGNRSHGVYPYYGANGILDYVDDYIFDGTYLLLGEDGSVINKDNSPVLHWATGKIWVNNHAHILQENDKALLRYLYYALQCTDVSDIVRGMPPKLNQANMRTILIPIPSISEQNRIVEILDTFTASIDNLKEQIAQRRKQYEYYRDQLLIFDSNISWYELLDLCDYVDYRGKTPKKVDFGVFLVTAKNIRKGYIDYENSKEYVSLADYEIVMRRGKPKIGDVLITTEAPCGNVAQVDNDSIALAQRVIKYRPKDKRLNSTFLKYLLLGTDFQNRLDKEATGATAKGIKGSKLHKLKIPLPPLQEQLRIVSILDTFEASIQNLEAQLAGREKQYEYYRNKLLTFE